MFRKATYATVSGGDAHHDVLLSNLAVSAFDTGVDGLIGNKLFPRVPVGKQSDRYAIINKGAFLRVPNTRRAPRTQANRVEFTASSDRYFADNFALAGEIPLEDLNNADIAFQLRENTTSLVIGDLLRDQEQRIINLVTSASNLGSGTILSGANQWSDFVNSDPLGDVTTGHAFIRKQTGLVANTMAMDWDVFQLIRRHPSLLDMYKYTNGGMLDDTQLKAAFRVDNLLISRAVKENNRESDIPAAASSMTALWGTGVLLAHIEPGVSLQTRTLGLRFGWTPPIYPADMAVGTAREEGPGKRNVEIIEAGYYQDEKLVAADLGYLIASVVA